MTNNQSIKTLLGLATKLLNSDAALFEAQLLLQHVLNVNRAWLIAHEDGELTSEQFLAFDALLQRRIDGEPVAYILGYREFFGLKLKVTPDTLIPRPDTEILVEAALEKIPQKQPDKILDLGTGTGAIALAIAKNRSNAQVTAVDFSTNALIVAQENAKNLHIQNVTFLQSDWFSAIQNQRFDVIVSNPPYIENDDAHVNQGDLRFEPKSALTSGADGLDDIRKIIRESLMFLNPQGWLMLEHGYNQAEKVRDLMVANGFLEVATIRDFGGNDRVTMGKRAPT
jgi:release factor glutamine methyltransferase